MTYERRGVQVIQELLSQSPTLNTPQLTSLLVGPCNQVISDYQILSSIPYSEEELDVSDVAQSEAKLFTGLPTFVYGKHYVDAIYYDSNADAYFPAIEITAGAAVLINADVAETDTAIKVSGDYSAYGNGSSLVIFDGTNIKYSPISDATYSGSDTTFTVPKVGHNYTVADGTTVLLIDSVPMGDFFMEVIPTSASTRTSSSIVFVKQSSDTFTSLRAVITSYPLTISYPNLKPGAIVDQSKVSFTLKDAKAVIAEGFMSGVGESNTFSSIDATGKIVTLTDDFPTGTAANEYKGLYLELSNATYIERRLITANDAAGGNRTVTVSEAFAGTYAQADTASIFVLQEIGDSTINTFGALNFTDLGVDPGDVIVFSNNGGSYIISSVDSADPSILHLSTSIYRALRGDDSSISKFTIYRYYGELDLSDDVGVKDWITESDSCTIFSIEDNENNRVVDGKLYMSYVAFRTDISNQILKYNNETELKAAMDVNLENPLGYALMIALANNDQTPAYGLAVISNDQAGYSQALELTEGRDDLYCLVPLSQDSTVTGLTKTNVQEQSMPINSNFRITLITTPLQTTESVSTGSGAIL